MKDESTSLLDQSIRHAWDWFALHANQRMQGVNFFLLAAAFLSTAYVGAMQRDKFVVAGGVAALGCWFCLVFYRFELRIRELIKAGEKALEQSQERLSRLTEIQEFEICKFVEKPKRIFTSYHKVISALYGLTGIGFLLGCFYALYPVMRRIGVVSLQGSTMLFRILLVVAATLSLYWAQRLVRGTAGSQDWFSRSVAILFALGGLTVLVLSARGI
jgi:hypothetical protein